MADNVLELNDGNFDEQVIQSDQPVLVDFWAPWCQPCLRLAPTIEEIAGETEGKVRVGKLNTDENQASAAKYGISGLPTVMLFKGGEPVDQVMGLAPKEKFDAMLASHVG